MDPHAKIEPPLVCADADVLIAGLFSTKGASHALLVLAEIGLVRVAVPASAVDEVRRNVAAKLPSPPLPPGAPSAPKPPGAPSAPKPPAPPAPPAVSEDQTTVTAPVAAADDDGPKLAGPPGPNYKPTPPKPYVPKHKR